jgi:hypothetical protein
VTRFRCLGCELFDQPHWHSDSVKPVKPALHVRLLPRGAGSGVVFDLGAAMGLSKPADPSDLTRALLEVIAEDKAQAKPGEVLRFGFPGTLHRAAIRQIENTNKQRRDAAKKERGFRKVLKETTLSETLAAHPGLQGKGPAAIARRIRRDHEKHPKLPTKRSLEVMIGALLKERRN